MVLVAERIEIGRVENAIRPISCRLHVVDHVGRAQISAPQALFAVRMKTDITVTRLIPFAGIAALAG